MEENLPALRTQQLTRHFETFVAVDHIDLQIPHGQIFGLLGPNGAGKSTTIKMLTTLLPPSAGTAQVAGFDITTDPIQVRRRIGYVPQLLSADGALTAAENMLLSARLYGMPRNERMDRIREALAFMDLEEHANKMVQAYSGGMIRRLEIAQALLHRPVILFLDEPTIGLDPVARHAVWDRLMDLREDLGLTVLLTTHDMEEADTLCDGLALMHHAHIVVSGKPSDLKAQVGPDASLNDVFAKFCGETLQEGGTFRHVKETRRAIRKRG